MKSYTIIVLKLFFMIDLNQFKNKRILITGASNGLGFSCAQYFSKLDAKILLSGKDKSKLSKRISKLKNPKKHRVFEYDLNIKKNIEKLSNIIIEKKFYDIIIHCLGGGFSKRDPLIGIDDMEKLFRVNLGAIIQINKNIITHLKGENKHLNIVHVGSSASTNAIASVGYNIVKAALSAYVRSLGREMAITKININGILPGAFKAPDNSWERLIATKPEVVNNFIDTKLPRKKLGTADELLPMIGFLASKESSMMRGCCVPIDAGESLNYDGMINL